MNTQMSGDCTGRTDELLDLLDGELEMVRAAELKSHLATCPACRQAHARLAAVDQRLDAVLSSVDASAAFDARVLRRIDELTVYAREARAESRHAAEAERIMALEALRSAAGRGWKLSVLDVAGTAALLLLAGHLVTRFFGAIGGLTVNFGSVVTVPTAAFVVATISVLAVVAVFGLGRSQPALLDA